MIYSLPVEYTNTIFSGYAYKNAGGDPQMVLSTIQKYRGITDSTRCLISPPLAFSDFHNVDKIDLVLQVSHADLFTSDQIVLQLFAISRSWAPGVSLFDYQTPRHANIQQGSTWRNAKTNDAWTQLGGDYITPSVGSYTVSYRNIYDPINIDVTSYTNSSYGFLLTLADQSVEIGTINIYSTNTNTIFYPKYVAYVQDYAYTQSSASSSTIVTSANQDQYMFGLKNLQTKYNGTDVVKLLVGITPKVYSRDWTQARHYYSTDSITLTGSVTASYAIYDISQLAKLVAVPHSEYTRISCDGTTNYFNCDMSVLQQDKYYEIELKIGNRTYTDAGVFKIA